MNNLTLHLKLSIILSLIVAILGCSTTKHSLIEGQKDGEVYIYFGPFSKNEDLLSDIGMKAKDTLKLDEAISKFCATKKPDKIAQRDEQLAITPIAAVVWTAIGKSAINLYADYSSRKIDQIKQSAQATYSQRAIIKEGAKDLKCILVARRDAIDETKDKRSETGSPTLPYMVILLAIDTVDKKKGKISQLKIPFARIYKSAAHTGKESKKISLNIAINIKQIKENYNAYQGEPTSIVKAETSIPTLNIGNDATPSSCWLLEQNKADPQCPSSDIFLFNPDNTKETSITVAITETGFVGINFDSRTAAISTLRATLGTAVEDAIAAETKN